MALSDRDPDVYTRYVQIMDGNQREAPSGRERVRAILDDRADAGIEMDEGEVMGLAASEQHGERSPAAALGHTSDGLPFTIRFSDGGDGWVMAQVQEVPGAVSQGRTEAEARANVVDALLLILRSDAGSVVDAGGESQVLPEPVGQRFDTRVSLGESETTVSLPALRLIGAGETFDAAVDDLVEVLREYSSQYLRRIDFDRQAAQGSLSPLIFVFALTPAEEQRDLFLRPPTATAGGLRRTP